MRNISFDCCDGTVVSISPVEDPDDWNIHLMLAFPLSGTERNAKVTLLLVRLRSRYNQINNVIRRYALAEMKSQRLWWLPHPQLFRSIQ